MIDRGLNYGRHILLSFTKKLAGKDIEAVLDIGAGGGGDLLICKNNLPNANFFAIEGHQPNVLKLQNLGFNTQCINLEKDSFPFKNDLFDVIIANQILEHCKEIFWIFHEVSRTLKIGGYFYIGVPNLASFHSRLLLVVGRQPTCIQTASAHIRGFTKIDLLKFTESCFPGGYTIELFKGSNFYPFPPFIAKPLAELFPNSSVCIFIVLKKSKEYNSEFIKFPIGLETNYWIGNN